MLTLALIQHCNNARVFGPLKCDSGQKGLKLFGQHSEILVIVVQLPVETGLQNHDSLTRKSVIGHHFKVHKVAKSFLKLHWCTNNFIKSSFIYEQDKYFEIPFEIVGTMLIKYLAPLCVRYA